MSYLSSIEGSQSASGGSLTFQFWSSENSGATKARKLAPLFGFLLAVAGFALQFHATRKLEDLENSTGNNHQAQDALALLAIVPPLLAFLGMCAKYDALHIASVALALQLIPNMVQKADTLRILLAGPLLAELPSLLSQTRQLMLAVVFLLTAQFLSFAPWLRKRSTLVSTQGHIGVKVLVALGMLATTAGGVVVYSYMANNDNLKVLACSNTGKLQLIMLSVPPLLVAALSGLIWCNPHNRAYAGGVIALVSSNGFGLVTSLIDTVNAFNGENYNCDGGAKFLLVLRSALGLQIAGLLLLLLGWCHHLHISGGGDGEHSGNGDGVGGGVGGVGRKSSNYTQFPDQYQ
jgi:hypothetical protein